MVLDIVKFPRDLQRVVQYPLTRRPLCIEERAEHCVTRPTGGSLVKFEQNPGHSFAAVDISFECPLGLFSPDIIKIIYRHLFLLSRSSDFRAFTEISWRS